MDAEAPIVLSTFGSLARQGYEMSVHCWRYQRWETIDLARFPAAMSYIGRQFRCSCGERCRPTISPSTRKGPKHGEVARGIASAALTLQSVLLQAHVAKGVLTSAEALTIADKSITAASAPGDDDADVADVTLACLEHIREGLAAMAGEA